MKLSDVAPGTLQDAAQIMATELGEVVEPGSSAELELMRLITISALALSVVSVAIKNSYAPKTK